MKSKVIISSLCVAVIVGCVLYSLQSQRVENKIALTESFMLDTPSESVLQLTSQVEVEARVEKKHPIKKKINALYKNENFEVVSSLLPIFAENKKLDDFEKVKLIKALPDDISDEYLNSLYLYLENEVNNEDTLWIKDEVMCRLEKIRPRPGSLIGVLGELALDQSLDGEFRGYVVQHLRLAYDEHIDEDKASLAEIKSVLFDALDDHGSDISGTALLALVNLSEKYPKHFDQDAISQKAIELISSDELILSSKISAVQLCGQRKLQESYNVIRDLLSDECNTGLKLAALSAMGELGTVTDLELLENIAQNGHRILQSAAIKAADKIAKR